MQIYFCFQVSKCWSCSMAPLCWCTFLYTFPLGKKKSQNAFAGPGTNLAGPFFPFPLLKCPRRRPAAFSRFSWGVASCDFNSSFASSKDRGLLLFPSSESQIHTHTCSSVKLKCFSLIRKEVRISNFWNFHLVLSYVWAQPPQVELSPWLLLLLTDRLTAWTGIIIFFLCRLFSAGHFLIQLTPELHCQLWEVVEFLEQGQAGHGAAPFRVSPALN